MADIMNSILNLRLLDELARKETPIHRIHPIGKLLITLAFLIFTASFGKYAVAGLLPMALYPLATIILGELPASKLLARALFAAPFILGIGILNPIFDQTPFPIFGHVTITGGWLSFFSIMLRLGLSVLAVLILIATSGMEGICMAMSRLKAPRIFVTQLLLMYRYLELLMEESARIVRAYSLRSRNGGKISFKAWGSFLGRLLLRTVDRAYRIYQAMRCRGFAGEIRPADASAFRTRDFVYISSWLCYFTLVRLINIPEYLGSALKVL
ncbi:MAG: cobalt ECF transporter T component CbiQ [Bacillota bacterium]